MIIPASNTDKLKLVGTDSHHGLQIPRGDSGEGDCFDKCAVGRIKKKKVVDRAVLHAAA